MKILVIDDAQRNIASAKGTLAGHEVTTCNTIQSARNILYDSDQQFDAVLTDLFMPVGDYRGAMAPGAKPPANEIPAGLVFALNAINKGIRVVLCTDSDHHQDWICSLLDIVGDQLTQQHKVASVEARYARVDGYWDEEGQRVVLDKDCYGKGYPIVKDWHDVMVMSGLFSKEEIGK